MPRPYASIVIVAVEQVWDAVRDFNTLDSWYRAIEASALDSGSRGAVKKRYA